MYNAKLPKRFHEEEIVQIQKARTQTAAKTGTGTGQKGESSILERQAAGKQKHKNNIRCPAFERLEKKHKTFE